VARELAAREFFFQTQTDFRDRNTSRLRMARSVYTLSYRASWKKRQRKKMLADD